MLKRNRGIFIAVFPENQPMNSWLIVVSEIKLEKAFKNI